MDEKYIVFKRDEFLKADGPFSPVGDAVVIRRQDVFAPPALDAYANSIQCAIEIMKTSDDPRPTESLQEIADYFHEQAKLAWDTDRKIPD